MFPDTCTLTRESAASAPDSTWGTVTTASTVVYSGACRVSGFNAQILRLASGDKDVDHDAVVYLPEGNFSQYAGWPPAKDDLITIGSRTGRVIDVTDFTRDFYTRLLVRYNVT